jgi:hypothetical protein
LAAISYTVTGSAALSFRLLFYEKPFGFSMLLLEASFGSVDAHSSASACLIFSIFVCIDCRSFGLSDESLGYFDGFLVAADDEKTLSLLA